MAYNKNIKWKPTRWALPKALAVSIYVKRYMNMQIATLVFLLIWSKVALCGYVEYEFGSYRDKVLLKYSEYSLTFVRLAGGSETLLCSKALSEKTLSHSLSVFSELGVENWNETYFAVDRLDGVTFRFKTQIDDFKKSVVGHIDFAPENHKKLVKYFNEILGVNGCDKFI